MLEWLFKILNKERVKSVKELNKRKWEILKQIKELDWEYDFCTPNYKGKTWSEYRRPEIKTELSKLHFELNEIEQQLNAKA